MNFRTTISQLLYTPKIAHSSKIISLGSCFAVEIFNKLSNLKFDIISNPNGILFNPLSIANSLESLVSGKTYQLTDLVFEKDLYFSWDHHGSFSGMDHYHVLDHINTTINNGNKMIQEADWLMITFGTAYVYQLINSGKVVGNCHKQSSGLFERNLCEVDTIVTRFKKVIQSIRRLNPNINIVFSVSPVRHMSDGMVENSRSKAILNNAVHQLVDESPNVHYFPSYEIMMDDLRDYRFYNRDKIHPNEEAVDYIWKFFQNGFFESETEMLNVKIYNIHRSLSHKPRQLNSESHINFLHSLVEKMHKLQSSNNINYSAEIKNIQLLLPG